MNSATVTDWVCNVLKSRAFAEASFKKPTYIARAGWGHGVL